MGKTKILFLSLWWPANTQRWLAEGFKQNSCDVRLVGTHMKQHYGIKWPDDDYPELFFNVLEKENLNLKEIVDKSTAKGFTPDLLVINDDWRDYGIKETENRIPLILNQTEGWEKDLKRIHLFKPTLAFAQMPYGVFPEPRNEIYPGWEWMPGAADPFAHPYLNLKRDLDFVFFGALNYDKRLELCNLIRDANYNVKFGQVPVKEYAYYHNKSLTTMECSAGQGLLKIRIFEAMSMGCLVISNEFNLINKLFRPYIHYIPCKCLKDEIGKPYLDPDDLKNQINIIKKDNDLRKYITDNAFNLVRKKHTYYHRARLILNKLEMI